MKLQTDRKIEISRVIEHAKGIYTDARDLDDETLNAPATIEGKEFAPEIEVKVGDLLLVKVLE